MPIELLPVPANSDECIRRMRAAGFIFSESLHAPLLSIPPHAHEHATITILMKGLFEERCGSRTESCQSSSVLFRPPGQPHSDRFGSSGGFNLVIEIEDHRLAAIEPYSRVLTS